QRYSGVAGCRPPWASRGHCERTSAWPCPPVGSVLRARQEIPPLSAAPLGPDRRRPPPCRGLPGPLFLGPSWSTSSLPLASLTDRQLPSSERCSMQGLDRRLGLQAIWHLDQAKAARAPGLTISHHLHALHGPIPIAQLV